MELNPLVRRVHCKESADAGWEFERQAPSVVSFLFWHVYPHFRNPTRSPLMELMKGEN